MRKLKRFFAREDGIAMATVIAMTTVLTLLSIVLIDQVTAETNNSGAAATSDSVYQAAEAGANDYIAKLTDDPQYYDHYVAKGEATRQGANGTIVAHSTSTVNNTWPSGVTWTYPNKKDWWYAGAGSAYSNTTSLRGFAYDLMITPPSEALGTNYINIVSTGCKVLDMNATPLQCDPKVAMRSVELYVRRSTPADFQYMVDYDPTKYDPVCYGSTLYGKVYSTQDICFNSTGISYGDVMAEGNVTGISSDRLRNGARIYDSTHPDIRTVVPNPITFASLGDPSIDIKRSAANNVPSTDFEDATNAKAWRINFTSDGNVQVWKCTFASGSPDPASSQPYCNDVNLTSNVSIKNSSATNMNVNESTASFPAATSSSPQTAYVGSSPGRIDTVTYTGLGTTSLTGVKCTTCGASTITHNSGEVVSIKSGGLGWAAPFFNNPIPSNGAIYTGQDAIISWPTTINGYSSTSQDGSPTSVVNGRVTVASGGDIIIGGDIHYASEPASDGIGGPDDDVLGLIAKSNVWLPKYAPTNLWFRAATMAITGIWSDYNCTNTGPDRGSSSSMTFVGTSAYTNPTGCMQAQDNNGYHGYRIVNVSRIADDGSAGAANSAYAQYDALKFLFPPWFPVINGMETTVLFREVPAGFIPPAAPTG